MAMKMTFYGVRGSLATPGPQTVLYGGNTSCLEVIAASGQVSIFDAGTGIRQAGERLLERNEHNKHSNEHKGDSASAKIFVTHNHWDHIQGFSFFRPAYMPGYALDIYAGSSTPKAESRTARNKERQMNKTKEMLQGLHNKTQGYFPVSLGEMLSDMRCHVLKDWETVENDRAGNKATVTTRFFAAHPGGVWAYKIEEMGRSIVTTGDYEHDGSGLGVFGQEDKKLIEFAQGVDVLVMDGQYTKEEYEKKKGWGHSQMERVCEIAAAADVKRLVITHHDPSHDDETLAHSEQATQRYMQEVLVRSIPVSFAREGMIVEL